MRCSSFSRRVSTLERELCILCRGGFIAETSDCTTRRLAEMFSELEARVASLSVPNCETDLSER
jgi:hypothetical protein